MGKANTEVDYEELANTLDTLIDQYHEGFAHLLCGEDVILEVRLKKCSDSPFILGVIEADDDIRGIIRNRYSRFILDKKLKKREELYDTWGYGNMQEFIDDQERRLKERILFNAVFAGSNVGDVGKKRIMEMNKAVGTSLNQYSGVNIFTLEDIERAMQHLTKVRFQSREPLNLLLTSHYLYSIMGDVGTEFFNNRIIEGVPMFESKYITKEDINAYLTKGELEKLMADVVIFNLVCSTQSLDHPMKLGLLERLIQANTSALYIAMVNSKQYDQMMDAQGEYRKNYLKLRGMVNEKELFRLFRLTGQKMELSTTDKEEYEQYLNALWQEYEPDMRDIWDQLSETIPPRVVHPIPNPVINLIANLAHSMYDPIGMNPNAAKQFLRELWNLVMSVREDLSSSTDVYIDRCSEGGVAIHYPSDSASVLNCFIKKAPSREWAEQAHRFSERYKEGKEMHQKFRMSISQPPFYYDGLTLYLTDFVLGLDLDEFFLCSHSGVKGDADKYIPYAEAIAKRGLDDLVFWQLDSKSEGVMELPKPTSTDIKTDIKDDLKTNLLLAVEHAKQFGSVNIENEELELLNNALEIFDELTLNKATTIVPILDYCPKNMGIKTNKVDPDIGDVVKEISTGSKPDPKKIAEKLYHWDPAAKWGHFLEDFFAFFNSYEFGLFSGRKNIISLDDRYRLFLNLKYKRDNTFKRWVNNLKLESRGGLINKLANRFIPDRYLMQFYRAIRKSDLSLTRYAWMNENLGKQRIKKIYSEQRSYYETEPSRYRETRDLLPSHIYFYSKGAAQAIKSLIGSFGDYAKEMLSEFEKLQGDTNRSIEYFENAMGVKEDRKKRIINALYLLYIAYRLEEREINYDAIEKIRNPAEFAKLTFSR